MENSRNFIFSFEFFKDATENKNGRQRLNLFVGAKTLKPRLRNYSNFIITFPTIWRCAGDFHGFTEIQNGRQGTTSIFLWAQKLKKLVWSIFFLNVNMIHHILSNIGMCK